MLKSLAEAERFLERQPIACIATVDSEGKAHVVPVWFTYNNGKVHIQTDRKSVKVRNLRRNESVAVAIYTLADEAVTIRGRGRIIEDEKQFRKRTQQHIDKYRIELDEHGRDNMGYPCLTARSAALSKSTKRRYCSGSYPLPSLQLFKCDCVLNKLEHNV